MTDKRLQLDDAYSIRTPDDATRLYAEWAEGYDTDFAEEHGYVMPRAISRTFAAHAGGADVPVLDIGAGTGLVAQHLAPALNGPIDGIDISAEMLGVAREKAVYRDLIEADLTRPLDIASNTYGGLISAGTFTHGHVGPGVLPEIVRIARPGALCVFSIKPEVFDEAHFGSAFATLIAERRITPFDVQQVRVYDREDHDHGMDTSLILIFRTAA